MKKRICALCAALVVVCCSVAPAFAVQESWFNKWYEGFAEALKQPYWIAQNWGDKNQYSEVVPTSEFAWISAYLQPDKQSVFLMHRNPADTAGSGFIIPLSGITAKKIAWNFSIPVTASIDDKTIAGYLYPNPDGLGGKFFHAEPYNPDTGGSGPDYGLDNGWLENNPGTEGVYIIAPKNGKVFNGTQGATQIVAQYRFKKRALYSEYFKFYGYNKTLGVDLTGDIWDFEINLKTSATQIVSNDHKVVTDADGVEWIEGTLTINGKTPRNCEVEVYLKAAYVPSFVVDVGGGAIGGQGLYKHKSNVVTFSWYEDFIDEDGDGNDDRDKDPGFKPNVPPVGSDDLSGLDDIGDILNSFKGAIGGLFAFLAEFFSFLPGGIFTIMGAGVLVIILLRVFGR